MINKSFKLKLRNLSIDQYNLLFDLCSNSKNLYNQSLYKIREQYKLDKSYSSSYFIDVNYELQPLMNRISYVRPEIEVDKNDSILLPVFLKKAA